MKKIEGNELYLFMNGELIYKRWLDTGESKVFDVMAYNKYTLTSIRDLAYENHNGLLSIKARLKLKSTEGGGRLSGLLAGIGQITFLNIMTVTSYCRHILATSFLMEVQLLNQGKNERLP